MSQPEQQQTKECCVVISINEAATGGCRMQTKRIRREDYDQLKTMCPICKRKQLIEQRD